MRPAIFSKGFTLIELLIVIAVIGILATLRLFLIDPLEQLRKGRDVERKALTKDLFGAWNRVTLHSLVNTLEYSTTIY